MLASSRDHEVFSFLIKRSAICISLLEA